MLLKDISDIIYGYTFRGAIIADSQGDTYVFQAKDLVQGAPVIHTDSLTRIIHPSKGRIGFLQKNDVLLVARGMKSGAFRSTVFLSDAQNVIASASVHIIHVTSSNVMPEYVSQYLNSDGGQTSLVDIVSGSYIGAILRKDLEDIDVPVPTLEKQHLLVDLYKNIQEQKRLSDREIEIKQSLINSIYRKAAMI